MAAAIGVPRSVLEGDYRGREFVYLGPHPSYFTVAHSMRRMRRRGLHLLLTVRREFARFV